MFDLSLSEILIIGAVALIVIGPKEMPSLLRGAGHMMRKARGIMDDFKSAIDPVMHDKREEKDDR